MAKKKTIQPLMGRHGKDQYSGIEGTIRGIKILATGCVHVLVHPNGVDAFKQPLKAQWVQGKTRTNNGLPSPKYTFDSTYAKRVDQKPVKKSEKSGSPAFLPRG